MDRYAFARSFVPLLALMLAGVAVIYACGALHLSMVLRTGLKETMLLAVWPFILLDVAKALVAASVGAALLPGASHTGDAHGADVGRAS